MTIVLRDGWGKEVVRLAGSAASDAFWSAREARMTIADYLWTKYKPPLDKQLSTGHTSVLRFLCRRPAVDRLRLIHEGDFVPQDVGSIAGYISGR